jgi:hypothetical protein
MLVNEALIKGNMKEVHRLVQEGHSWQGPKDSYNGKQLTSKSFTFPSTNSELADLMLTVLDFGLIDLNGGANGVDWEWFITINGPVNPDRKPISGLFAVLHGTYIASDCVSILDSEEHRPQLKISCAGGPGLYHFLIEKYDDNGSPHITYSNLFGRTDAMELLSTIDVCENIPYSC